MQRCLQDEIEQTPESGDGVTDWDGLVEELSGWDEIPGFDDGPDRAAAT